MAANNSSSDDRTRRQRQLTTKGHDFAIDIMRKEVKRRIRKLTNHKSLFADLMRTSDINLTKRELSKLDVLLVELEEASNKLLEVTQGDEKKQIVDVLQTERDNASELKATVKEWLDTQDRDGQSGGVLISNDGEGKSATRLTSELIGVQSRLESQVSLCGQLLQSNDRPLVQQELRHWRRPW